MRIKPEYAFALCIARTESKVPVGPWPLGIGKDAWHFDEVEIITGRRHQNNLKKSPQATLGANENRL
jgi:hypothetical protein